MHWTLDVTFDEDHSTLRNGHSVENTAIFRKYALNLVKKEKLAKEVLMGRDLNVGIFAVGQLEFKS